jgi:hypothetical protein
MATDLSPFQEMLQEDVWEVFLNCEEFASPHLIEGKTVMAVIAPDQSIPIGGGYTHGVSESAITLYAATSDLPKKKAGNVLNVDGREYTVGKWNEHQGMTEVFLSHPEMY